MKAIFKFILFLFSFQATAQNMVPNHSFEQYIACPDDQTQIWKSTDWRSYSNGTPDYYHVCGTNGFSVPSTIVGYQQPASGKAFAGLHSFSPVPNVKEYMTTQISALQIGCTYEVSMSVSLADRSRWASNDLGVFFFDGGPSHYNTKDKIPHTPQVTYYHYGIRKDSVGWTRLRNTFVADSTYDNIVIGGFLLNTAIDTELVNSFGGGMAHYFIDSVVVRPLRVHFNYDDTFHCQGQQITVNYDALACSGSFLSGNIFRLQLSDANGNFFNPVNIGSVTATGAGTIVGTIPNNTPTGSQYRIRIVSTSPKDSSMDNGYPLQIGTPVSIKANTPLCEGEKLLMIAGGYFPGTTFSWTGPGVSTTQQVFDISNVTNANAGLYTVVATYNGCNGQDTKTVVVNPIPVLSAGSNSPLCPGAGIQFGVSNSLSGGTYQWSGPGFSSTDKNPLIPNADKTHTGTYTVTATVANCTSLPDTVEVQVKDQPLPPLVKDTTLCRYAENITLPAIGDSLRWYASMTGSSGSFEPSINTADTAKKQLYVSQTVDGCESNKSTFSINMIEVPQFNLGTDISLCTGQSTMIGVDKAGVTHHWNTGEQGCCIRVDSAGTYTQSMTNICGTTSDEIEVAIRPCYNCLYFASAFTPNGDGLNDRFGAGSICNLKEYTLKIFSRWGEMVFMSTDINHKWDGTNNGKKLSPDTYFYFVQYAADIPGRSEKFTEKGDVTLVR